MTQILIIAVALIVPGCVVWIAVDLFLRRKTAANRKAVFPVRMDATGRWQPLAASDAASCDMVVTLQPRTKFGVERVEKFSKLEIAK